MPFRRSGSLPGGVWVGGSSSTVALAALSLGSRVCPNQGDRHPEDARGRDRKHGILLRQRPALSHMPWCLLWAWPQLCSGGLGVQRALLPPNPVSPCSFPRALIHNDALVQDPCQYLLPDNPVCATTCSLKAISFTRRL